MLFNSESSCPQLFQAQKLATLSSLDDHRQTFQSFGRDGLLTAFHLLCFFRDHFFVLTL